MGDRRARGVPQRWLLPPPPTDPRLATRWNALPFERRRRLARVGADELDSLSPADREVVAGLARRRIATGWRLAAASLVLGWLMLMAVWGFGRSTFSVDAVAWLLGGLVAGAFTTGVALVGARRRLRRARTVLGGAISPSASL